MVKSTTPPTAVALKIGGSVLASYPAIGWSVVEVPLGRLKQSKALIESSNGVQLVQYDRAAQPAYTPNDPLWPNEWHMRTIKADLAWDTSKGSSNTIVAVIDTGIFVAHPDLATNIWVNQGEIPNNNIDDDNNGYVDDVNGYDFAYNDGNPEDTLGHGTGCAGLVGAVQDNNLGISGACPKVRIMNLKACNDNGLLYDSYLVPAYIYGADNGARVYSMSYFSDRVSQAEKDAMDYAVARNVLPIAAAGNAASVLPYYPAAYENVLSVAATNGNNNRSWFSNFGSWVDVAAPGEGLTTTSNNGDYMGFGGTSGACPHVAGSAALMIGAKPSATAKEVRYALEDTATLLNQPPWEEFSNYGLIDTEAALKAILTTPAPPKPAIVRYIATMGQSLSRAAKDPSLSVVARIYGRGFQGLQNLVVKRNGVPAQVLTVTRDYIDYSHVYRLISDVSVWNGDSMIATLPNPTVIRDCHPLVEASAPSAWVDGSFRETLIDDGVNMLGHRDGDGNIILHGTFRKMTANSITQLRIKRSYALGGGNESIQIYDWASFSYPYGNWIEVAAGTASTTPSVTTANLPNLANYIDFEGTVYFRVVTTSTPENQVLKIDSARLQSNR